MARRGVARRRPPLWRPRRRHARARRWLGRLRFGSSWRALGADSLSAALQVVVRAYTEHCQAWLGGPRGVIPACWRYPLPRLPPPPLPAVSGHGEGCECCRQLWSCKAGGRRPPCRQRESVATVSVLRARLIAAQAIRAAQFFVGDTFLRHAHCSGRVSAGHRRCRRCSCRRRQRGRRRRRASGGGCGAGGVQVARRWHSLILTGRCTMSAPKGLARGRWRRVGEPEGAQEHLLLF